MPPINQLFQIAIDGPSGSGKSTMAKRLAKTLGIGYLDTGAMYRALGYAALKQHIVPGDAVDVEPMLLATDLDVAFDGDRQMTLINGEDVSPFIRTPEVSMAASDISALPAVRHYCVARQREFAKQHSVVLDGRDIGTYVLPHATLKFFLTADDTIRAKRRLRDLQAAGVNVDEAEVLRDLRRRDEQDSTREMAPTMAASDAVLIDTSDLTEEEVFSLILSYCERYGCQN